MKYEDVLADWEYLWSIGPAQDMTGGYVDSSDLERLLYSPTKKTARYCLESQITYWFQIGPDTSGQKQFEGDGDYQYWIDKDPRVKEIYERY